MSLKSKEFTQEAVTEALQDALNREFEFLGVDYLKAKLSPPRATSGKVYHKLTLGLPKAAKLEEVLSEGELRAIAIASFLAELSLSGHRGGAVFDDPVSSLDHFRRVKVAKRLVEEAKQRQVIVFTHDTVFLGELRAVVEDEGVPNAVWDVVFNGVVERYRDWIKVGKLTGRIAVQQAECEELARLHNFASNVTEAHDHATARNAPVPDPAQLRRDIDALKSVIDGIRKRR